MAGGTKSITMSSSTDLPACEGCDLGFVVPGALGDVGVRMETWMKLSARVVAVFSLLGLLCMLSGCTSQKRGGGAAGVDAKESPKERYIGLVRGQVEKKWRSYSRLRRDGLTYGRLETVFYVTKKGKVEDVRIVNDKESNPILTGFTLRAIQDADIPLMPVDVIPSLPMNDPERLKIEYNVLIY